MVAHSKNEHWLSKVKEEALEPDLPICDPHHHLWEFRKGGCSSAICWMRSSAISAAGTTSSRLSSSNAGRCSRRTGPKHFRCVGETEFVNGIAAMSASGGYGKTRIAAGIIGTVDLRIGDAGGRCPGRAHRGRRRPISRDQARRFLAREPRHPEPPHQPARGPASARRLSRGLQASRPPQAQLRGLVRAHPDPRRHQPRASVPGHDDRARPFRRSDRHRPLHRQAGRGLCVLEDADRRAGTLPERGRETWRPQHGDQRLRLGAPSLAADQHRAAGSDTALLRAHDRALRRRAAACSSRTSRSTS